MSYDYKERIEKQRQEMTEFLQELVRIDSQNAKAHKTKEGEIYPFGKGVQEAFELVLNKAKEMDMDTENIDNYGGHIDIGGYILDEEGDVERTCPNTLGILAHLDVVPEGSGWTYPPFGGEIHDGKIYGRGTQDDKGPLVATLFAMKALMESGFVPAKKVRLILGLDEETGWLGMEHYFKYVEKPDFGFTPDGDFPVINGEKGIVTFELAKKFEKSTVDGLELRSIKGGSAPNMVAGSVRAVVRSKEAEQYSYIREEGKAFAEETGYKVNFKGVGKSLEISATGKEAHGAKPEDGINAISILMAFLGRLNFVNEGFNEVTDFYNKYIGMSTDGSGLGIDFCDEASGKLTLNVGQAYLDTKSVKLVINVRYPVSFDQQQIYEKVEPIVSKYNMGIVKGRNQEPIFIEEEHPLIKTLMDVYRENTGDSQSKPLVIGGGSYARVMDNAVAFGGMFPGDEDRMHQVDEYITEDNLVKMSKIFAEAIYRLSCNEEMEF